MAGCASHVQRARDLVQEGDREAAHGLLQQALREDPRDTGVRLELARFHVEDGDLVAAESQLRIALEVEPESVPALRTLALVLERLGSLSQAAQQLVRLRALQGAAAVPDARYVGLLRRAADGQFQHGDYAGAIQLYRQLAAAGPEHADRVRSRVEAAWSEEANRLAAEGQREAALDAWAEAEALNEAEPRYPFARGKLFVGINRPRDARAAFQAYITRSAPDARGQATAAARVGDWYDGQDAPFTAAIYYAQAASLDPDDTDVLLALAEQRLELRDVPGAREVLARYVARRGERVEVLRHVAERARSLGARRLAEDYFRRALKQSPGDLRSASALADATPTRRSRGGMMPRPEKSRTTGYSIT